MYRLGEPQRHKNKRWLLVALTLILILVAAAAWGAKYYLKSETTLTQSDPVVKPAVLPHAEKYQTVKGPTFSFEVPTTWKAVTNVPPSLYKIYRWQGTTVNDEHRWTDVYVDTIPDTFAVNHVTPIKANGSSISVLNDTSDNCANFTEAAKTTPQPATAPAKWSGVVFLCDIASTSRDVVGTATAETGNGVSLSGSMGTHRYFFVYTDNGGNPDYTVFSRQLKSFHSL